MPTIKQRGDKAKRPGSEYARYVSSELPETMQRQFKVRADTLAEFVKANDTFEAAMVKYLADNGNKTKPVFFIRGDNIDVDIADDQSTATPKGKQITGKFDLSSLARATEPAKAAIA